MGSLRCGVRRDGAYFFVIDAFIAGLILLTTIVLLFSHFVERSSSERVFYTAEDFLGFLDSTQVRDFDSARVRSWSADGTINDTSVSLLRQMGYFHARGQQAQLREFANITTQGVPGTVGIEIYVGGDSQFARVTDPPKDDAPVFFSSKRIVLLRRNATDTYAPALVEVQTWQ